MILLASRSPQRRALLGLLGLEFRVAVSGVPERTHGLDPVGLVVGNALAKARDVAMRVGVPAGGAILGADTEVVVDGRILGKPADAPGARNAVAGLAGRAHEVVTGIAVIGPDGERVAHERTLVRFRPLSDAEIDWYVATGEWRDRAGGYAIQGAGAVLVEGIEGDPTNVVGLPIAHTARLLGDQGLWPPR